MTSYESMNAHQLADQGIAQAAQNAGYDWCNQALQFLIAYAKRHREFAAFMVVAAAHADSDFIPAHSDKAWGAVFREAMRQGIICKTGRYVPHPKRHACEAILYEPVCAN